MNVQMQELGRFYLLESSTREGSYISESGFLPRGKNMSEADAIRLLEGDEAAEAIYEVCDGKFTDVSRDLAETWARKLAETFDPNHDEWPAFVQRHLSPLTLEEIEADILAEMTAHRDHVRSWSVPA